MIYCRRRGTQTGGGGVRAGDAFFSRLEDGEAIINFLTELILSDPGAPLLPPTLQYESAPPVCRIVSKLERQYYVSCSGKRNKRFLTTLS
jgi:hypothetical protein